MKQPKKIVPS